MNTPARRALLELTAILENASVAIVFTQKGVIQRCNRRTAEIFGYRGSDELGGRPAGALHPDAESYERLAHEAGPLLAGGGSFHADWQLRRADGSPVWCNLYGKAVDPERPEDGAVWIIEDVTEVRRTAEAQRRTAREMEAIMENAPIGIFFTRDQRLVRYNAKVAEIAGFHGESGVGMPTRAFFRSDEEHEALGREVAPLLSRGLPFQKELLLRRRDGTDVWVNLVAYVQNSEDTHEGTIWLLEDVTARKVAEESLRESETLQRAILQSASLVILATDKDGRIASCNPAGERMLGISAEALRGRLPTEVFFLEEELAEYCERARQETGAAHFDAMAALCAQPRLGRVEDGEWTFRRPDGGCFPVQLSIAPLRGGSTSVNGFLFVAADITERKRAEEVLKRSRDELEVRVKERTAKLEAEVVQRRRAEERLRYLALHDGLTGLANRTQLRTRTAKLVEHAVAAGDLGAVLFIDLDRFKNVNDTLGHRVGDALLKEVARRIRGAVRSGDLVARLGGDEFVVVATKVGRRESAEAIAEKILGALQLPIRVQQHELFATPSIGIAIFPGDGLTPDALVQKADAAMYQAKAAGRNTVRFFDPAMAASTERYLRTESSLRKAIERGELEPWYQPIVSLDTGECETLELLVRWRHPELGLVPPAEFIPIAEDSGLVGRIGALMLDAACRQHTAWRAAGYAVPRFALNLSATQFRDPRHLEGLAGTLSKHGMAPSCVELEITETALMQDGDNALAILQSLARAGFGISVDDFGTGYSSLAYLKSFPVGRLKIDKSFIHDMTRDPNDEAIVRMIIALARTLRIATVAEGVEIASQREALKRLGCDYAQGFLFARPMCAADLVAGSFVSAGDRDRCALALAGKGAR